MVMGGYPPQGFLNPAAVDDLQAGTDTIFSLAEDLRAILDLVGGEALQVVCDGTEQELLEIAGAEVPFFFAGLWIDWTGANFGAGEDTTVRLYKKVDGTNYRLFYTETFLAAARPVPIVTVHPRDAATDRVPDTFYSLQDIRVTIQQGAVGGGFNTLDYNIIRAMRSS